MRLILVAVLLVVYVCSTEAVIRCDENFCKTVTCDTTLTRDKCLSKGAVGGHIFKEKGSQCGCCDHCIRVIGENEDCRELLVLGVHFNSQCVAGTQCDVDSGKCKKKA